MRQLRCLPVDLLTWLNRYTHRILSNYFAYGNITHMFCRTPLGSPWNMSEPVLFLIRLFSQKQSVAQSLLFEQKKISTVEKILQSQNPSGLNQSSPVAPRLGRGLDLGNGAFTNSIINQLGQYFEQIPCWSLSFYKEQLQLHKVTIHPNSVNRAIQSLGWPISKTVNLAWQIFF